MCSPGRETLPEGRGGVCFLRDGQILVAKHDLQTWIAAGLVGVDRIVRYA